MTNISNPSNITAKSNLLELQTQLEEEERQLYRLKSNFEKK
jgi:hypothetical protein